MAAAGDGRPSPAHVPDHARHHHRHRLGGRDGRARRGLAAQGARQHRRSRHQHAGDFPGKGFGDTRVAKIKTLVLADAEALARQTYAAGVTPTVDDHRARCAIGAIEASAQVNGVGADYFPVKGIKLATGRFFDATRATRCPGSGHRRQTRARRCSGHGDSPLGKMILVGKVPGTVIGVTAKTAAASVRAASLSVYLALHDGPGAVARRQSLRSVVVRVADRRR